ncbi:hypothetical protein [Thiomicrospira sp.]|uniref:hypothetical protein n=1 Tax=Thiomicrospira sp. TaxID=935 RepID=UPI002F93659C
MKDEADKFTKDMFFAELVFSNWVAGLCDVTNHDCDSNVRKTQKAKPKKLVAKPQMSCRLESTLLPRKKLT